ncbi:NADH:flavin oxidoreductase/NADH oxidase [Streptomyces johnsoniae]|uniref:NADH:flavin oxidoreductase/NADH oxidase n=1 Tax=Streptomyces johnsoniae TaxID=3075532 RepID=A0ABU2SBI2_9ACTN|nr:NADH:flavin oxidoreductase/NADH oxidase [Streptomyces sp. DSM 41886]MDT0446293.1 NADH:flavin oxidoreductase/NADH oxidase [Streptomyces sp. DSM 41886]
MSSLFDPCTLRSLTIPNRVWMSPMCQYSARTSGPETGVANDWHFAHYAARAVGGAGLILTEATAVSPEGRISPADLGLWNDRQEAALRRIATAVRELGAVIGVQLAHAGRKASVDAPWRGGSPLGEEALGWRPVAPSGLAFSPGHAVPAQLSTAQIAAVTEDFARAAGRALAAGCQVAEVHGAHGYLLHQFLSPVSNRRTDAYGGDFAGRARFPLEVVDAVRAVWPADLPLFFRVSATDWLAEGGWTPDDTVRLAAELRARGVDLLDVSSGGNVPEARIPVGPGYQVPFAARVRAETGLPVGAVGLITEPQQAEKTVADGEADAVFLGRQLLREPYWPQRAARELGLPLTGVPDQYRRAH